MARHFTKQEIEEIRRQLATYGVRDSEFPEAMTVSSTDEVMILQDEKNKRLDVGKIENKIYTKILDEGIDGKVLSDNNYTTPEKNKLADIADGAQVNVIEQIKQDGVVRPISNKSVDIDLSDFVHKNLVPSEASPSNKLADKKYVHDEIIVSAATFRGTSPKDLTEEQFIAWANTREHDLNDYVYWDTIDANEIPIYKRYKWDNHEWVFEYVVNNSDFSDAQLAAINSGIDMTHVDKLDALPTRSELTAEFAEKQDVIEDLDEIRQNAETGGNAYHLPVTGIPSTDLSEGVNSSLAKAESAIQDVSDKISSDDIDDVIELTQEEFDALATKDPRTLYIVSDSTIESDHVGIASLVQTTVAATDEGINVWTCTLTNNQTFTLQVKNGSKGTSGYSGAAGELEVVNSLDSTDDTAALAASQGKVLNDNLTQLGQEVNGAIIDGEFTISATGEHSTSTGMVEFSPSIIPGNYGIKVDTGTTGNEGVIIVSVRYEGDGSKTSIGASSIGSTLYATFNRPVSKVGIYMSASVNQHTGTMPLSIQPVKSVAKSIRETEDEMGVLDFPVFSNSSIDANGVISALNGSTRSDYIDVSGLAYIYATNPNNTKEEYNAFYDSSKSFISGSRFNINANAVRQKIAVPSGAKYCIVSVRNYEPIVSLYKGGIIVDLETVKTSVLTIDESVKKFTIGGYFDSGSLNVLNTPGGYNLASTVTDKPYSGGGGYLFVIASNSRFMQKYYFAEQVRRLYYCVWDKTNSDFLVPWTNINKPALSSAGQDTTEPMSQKATTDYVDNPNRSAVLSGSINDCNKSGGYWVDEAADDLPESSSGALIVSPTSNGGRFVYKKYFTLTGSVWEQIFDTLNPSTPLVPWKITNREQDSATLDKTIVCFGDSIFGNADAESGAGEGVVSLMARYGNCVTKNCAFGGTTASLRSLSAWDAFSFVQLVDAILSNTWTEQDNALATSTELPTAKFTAHLATLKAIDWSSVNIVTVAFGANDFFANKALGDNTSNKNNYTGALLYGISKLQEAYPHIKFIILSPCWRWYADASGYLDHDSDTEENTLNLKVTDYVSACLSLADIIHIPGCDNYHKLGIGQYNYQGYFPYGAYPDGAHHSLAGRKELAHRVIAFIDANC